MKEQDSIKDLFGEAFKNFEEPVKPELWNKIASTINTVPTTPSSVSNPAAPLGTAGQFGGLASWIIGGAIVVAGLAATYYLTSTNDKQVTGQVTPTESVSQEISQPSNEVFQTEENHIQQSEKPTSQISQEPVKVTRKVTEGQNLHPVRSEMHSSASNVVTEPASDKSILNMAPSAMQGTSAPKEQVREEISGQVAQTSTEEHQKVSRLKTNPESGVAPLTVDFAYDGEVEKAEWAFGDGSNSAQLNLVQHTFDRPGKYNVTLRAQDEKGNWVTKNTIVTVYADLEIRNIPNIFTPNNDGSNDRFTFDTSQLTDYEVFIYNQAGKLIHKWAAPVDGWDGKLSSGNDALDGTYFYVIFATGENNQKHKQRGTITLRR